jgi:adenylate kinase family enzyme
MVIKIFKSGKLVPSEILVRLVKKAIKNAGWSGTYLLDGFPRSDKNIEAWD